MWDEVFKVFAFFIGWFSTPQGVICVKVTHDDERGR